MNEEVQSWNKQRYRFEVDSSPKAFEYYKKIYSERVKAAYQIDTPVFFRYNAENRKYIDAPEVALLNRHGDGRGRGCSPRGGKAGHAQRLDCAVYPLLYHFAG